MREVPNELLNYLMANVTGAKFEALAKRLFETEYGERFSPLGGIHDGGADGVLQPTLQVSDEQPNTFAQFSITADGGAQGKVAGTVEALRKAGRQPVQVIYATSMRLPKKDLIVQHIFSTYNVLAQVRDLEWIESVIRRSSAANQAFHDAFVHEINALSKASVPLAGRVNEYVKDPAVFAYLNHQLADRFAKTALHVPIVDALIYWALRDTDPDSTPPKLLSRSALSQALQSVFPNANAVLLPHLDERLKELSRKQSGQLERLRYYQKDDSFCLPFEMREQLAANALVELNAQGDFQRAVSTRLIDISGDTLKKKELDTCSALVFDSVHNYFVEQGTVLSAFLQKRLEKLEISDQVIEDELRKAISTQTKLKPGDLKTEHLIYCLRALRGVFYEPDDSERRYLDYLSRTSMLFSTLESSPRVIEYFNGMAGNFRLLVGTDILIKALTEIYLAPAQRQVTNLLSMAAATGATLILAAPVLEEVLTHLHAVDLEFWNHYAAREQYLTRPIVAQCDRILIRTYFYAKTTAGGPKTWQRFIDSMLDPNALRAKSEKARQDLQNYLVQKFRMRWVSDDELRQGVSPSAVEELASRLISSRRDKHEELSNNDALMVHAVYSGRVTRKEAALHDGFGFRTWWLTKEVTVLSHTGGLVMNHGGVPYIMRPEFLLNFIALAPKASQVREQFKALLPTTVGLQLGHHLAQQDMDKLLASVEEWASYEPERISTMLADKANRLMHDRMKQYVNKLD